MEYHSNEEQKMFQEDIIQICNNFRGDDLYVSPGIPNDKLCALAFTTMLPQNTLVFALIDTTVFGGAKNGMLITSNGLYIHNDNTANRPGIFYVSWNDLLQTENTMYPLRVELGELALTPNVQFEFSGCSMNADQLIPLLMNLRSAYRKYVAMPQTSQTPNIQPSPQPQPQPQQTQQQPPLQQKPLRQVKCTFCNSVFEAGPSNCPSCGAPISQQEIASTVDSPSVQNNSGNPPQAINSQQKQKKRAVYAILAVLFGCFGIHNFYAGRIVEGIFQFLLTVCTMGLGAVVTWPWALINIFVVKTDRKGNPFA